MVLLLAVGIPAVACGIFGLGVYFGFQFGREYQRGVNQGLAAGFKEATGRDPMWADLYEDDRLIIPTVAEAPPSPKVIPLKGHEGSGPC